MELLMIKQLKCFLLTTFLVSSAFPSATVAQVAQNNDSARASSINSGNHGNGGDSNNSGGKGVADAPSDSVKDKGVDSFASRNPSESYDRVWQMTGPFGGDVTAMAIDPRDADRIWLGTSDGQIFRSADGGSVWKRVRPGLKAPGFIITALLFDSEKSGVIYAGVKPLLDLTEEAPGGGVYLSEDGGESWNMLEGIRGRSIRTLTQSVKSPNVLVAAARDGVYYTRDRGKAWERITPVNDPELKGFHSVAIDPRDADIVYVGTHHLPWKTTDAGKTWKLAGSKEKGMIDDSDIFAIHIDETSPDTVLMSACSGIYRSRDASATWTKIQGIPYTSRRTHVIYQHPTRPEVIFAGTTEGLWVSTDNGKPDSWRRMTSVRLIINSIAIHPAHPDRIFLGTEDNGVLISVDGGESYDASNAGFINRQVRAVLADKVERGRVYAGIIFDHINGGLFVSEDGGVTWRQSMSGMGVRDVYSLYQSDSNPATIYAGTNQGLFRSDDHGVTWTQVKKDVPKEAGDDASKSASSSATEGESVASDPPPVKPVVRTASPGNTPKGRTQARAGAKSRNGKGRVVSRAKTKKPKPPAPQPEENKLVDLQNQVFAILPLVPLIAPSGSGEGDAQIPHEPAGQTPWILASTWDGLFVSEDEKKGWREIKFPKAAGQSGGADPASLIKINTIVTNPNAPGSIFIGTDEGLFVSRDNGESFKLLTLDEDTRRIRSVVFDPRNADTIYVGAANGFFRSLDGGRTWENRGGGMPLLTDVGAIVISAANPDELYLSDESRGLLFHSKDRGQNWDRVDISQLPSLKLWSLVSDPFDSNRIYAGSFSGGVYVMSAR
jgi:photosystem II stability/assembly factor-like uncharacterized protein